MFTDLFAQFQNNLFSDPETGLNAAEFRDALDSEEVEKLAEEIN